MSEPIELEHIDWVNDMDPALCQENLNKNQIALEQCVDVANAFNGLTNASNEKSYNYPKERYLANGSRLRSITSALKEKGVESTGIFNNIPSEIRSIVSGGGSGVGYIVCNNPMSEAAAMIATFRWGDKWGNGEDYISNSSTTEIEEGGIVIGYRNDYSMTERNTDSINMKRSASWCSYTGDIRYTSYTPESLGPTTRVTAKPCVQGEVLGKNNGLIAKYYDSMNFTVEVEEGYMCAFPLDSDDEEYWDTQYYYAGATLPNYFVSNTTYKFKTYKRG